MNEDEVLSSKESELNETYNLFIKYLKFYCKIDNEFYRIYGANGELNSFKNWLADENTLKAFFAAVGKYTSDSKRIERVDRSLETLIEKLTQAKINNSDPLYLDEFKKIKGGIDAKKVNVGNGTRKLIMDGFREYFMGEGEESFLECWKSSAS
jgi:hypothetical protein